MISIMSDTLNSLFEDVPSIALQENAVLFRTDENVRNLYLVVSGCIVLERFLETGTVTCLQRATSGQILAEASVYTDRYHCGARVLEPSTIKALPIARFRERLRASVNLAEEWAGYLARTVQATRFLSELRGMRTVSDRLDAWLAENCALPAKGQWSSLAAELAVSPEALYRELAKRNAT